MRREEIAVRAGISVDWYTRIELGSGAAPSPATLHAIARALELDAADTRYAFELAELPPPKLDVPADSAAIAALEAMMFDLQHNVAFVTDRYASPVCWNAAADTMFRFSHRGDAFDRNLIVAGLTDPYFQTFFGDDWEAVSRRTVGMFRRAYTTADPPPLAQRVCEFGLTDPWFQRFWNEHSVSEEFAPPGPFVRTVPGIGELRFDALDLTPLRGPEYIIRILAPHDDATRAKIPNLVAAGTGSGLLLV
jgi:transcriptional regulator with XRE-family HTH domain